MHIMYEARGLYLEMAVQVQGICPEPARPTNTSTFNALCPAEYKSSSVKGRLTSKAKGKAKAKAKAKDGSDEDEDDNDNDDNDTDQGAGQDLSLAYFERCNPSIGSEELLTLWAKVRNFISMVTASKMKMTQKLRLEEDPRGRMIATTQAYIPKSHASRQDRDWKVPILGAIIEAAIVPSYRPRLFQGAAGAVRVKLNKILSSYVDRSICDAEFPWPDGLDINTIKPKNIEPSMQRENAERLHILTTNLKRDEGQLKQLVTLVRSMPFAMEDKGKLLNSTVAQSLQTLLTVYNIYQAPPALFLGY
jgi:hypothetical protein